MQDKELFKEFVAFCESQPDIKRICHTSGWWDCAVGDFASHKGVTDTYLGDKFVPELLGSDNELYYTLDDPASCPTNYGDFTKLLKTYL